MTIQRGVDLANLHSDLARRLGLWVPGALPEFPFSVQMGFDVSPMFMWMVRANSATLNLTGAVGTFVSGDTMTRNRMAKLLMVRLGATTASSSIAAQVRNSVTPSSLTTIKLTADGTSEIVIRDEIWLGPGDQIGALATGNAGDSAISFHYMMLEMPGLNELQTRVEP